VTMGALCLMATSPAVAQTDRGGPGAAAPPGKLADRMPGTETHRMERGSYPTQSAQGGAAISSDDATDLRGLPDPPETVRRVQYQQKHNIEATGWLDRETKAKLGV
jgi:hypothetical protein